MVRGGRDCGERREGGGVYIHVLGVRVIVVLVSNNCIHPCSWISWTRMSLR